MIELHFIHWMLSISINKIVFSYCWEVSLEMEGGTASLFQAALWGEKKVVFQSKIFVLSLFHQVFSLTAVCSLQTELGFCNCGLSVSWPQSLICSILQGEFGPHCHLHITFGFYCCLQRCKIFVLFVHCRCGWGGFQISESSCFSPGSTRLTGIKNLSNLFLVEKHL